MKAGEAKERLEVAVTGTKAAQKIEAGGDAGEKATPTVADMSAAKTLIESWPPMSKKAAEQTLDKYGPPNEVMAGTTTGRGSAPSATATKFCPTSLPRTPTSSSSS